MSLANDLKAAADKRKAIADAVAEEASRVEAERKVAASVANPETGTAA